MSQELPGLNLPFVMHSPMGLREATFSWPQIPFSVVLRITSRSYMQNILYAQKCSTTALCCRYLFKIFFKSRLFPKMKEIQGRLQRIDKNNTETLA